MLVMASRISSAATGCEGLLIISGRPLKTTGSFFLASVTLELGAPVAGEAEDPSEILTALEGVGSVASNCSATTLAISNVGAAKYAPISFGDPTDAILCETLGSLLPECLNK